MEELHARYGCGFIYVPFWPRTSGTPVSFAFGSDVFHAARVKLYASVVSEKGDASVRTACKTGIVTARKTKYGGNVMSSRRPAAGCCGSLGSWQRRME
jgi:hypothetical protein